MVVAPGAPRPDRLYPLGRGQLAPRSLLYPTLFPANEGDRQWFESEFDDVGAEAISPAAIFSGAAALVAAQAALAADSAAAVVVGLTIHEYLGK